jgi:hypothetical protein
LEAQKTDKNDFLGGCGGVALCGSSRSAHVFSELKKVKTKLLNSNQDTSRGSVVRTSFDLSGRG